METLANPLANLYDGIENTFRKFYFKLREDLNDAREKSRLREEIKIIEYFRKKDDKIRELYCILDSERTNTMPGKKALSLDKRRRFIDEFFDDENIELGMISPDDGYLTDKISVPYDKTEISLPIVVGEKYNIVHNSQERTCYVINIVDFLSSNITRRKNEFVVITNESTPKISNIACVPFTCFKRENFVGSHLIYEKKEEIPGAYNPVFD